MIRSWRGRSRGLCGIRPLAQSRCFARARPVNTLRDPERRSSAPSSALGLGYLFASDCHETLPETKVSVPEVLPVARLGLLTV